MCSSMGNAANKTTSSRGVDINTVSTLKAGDRIDGNKVSLSDETSTGYKRAEDYAYWTTTRQDGSKSKGDYKGMTLTVQNVENKGSKVKVTAVFDLADLYRADDTENRRKAPKRVLTRTFNKSDMLKIYR